MRESAYSRRRRTEICIKDGGSAAAYIAAEVCSRYSVEDLQEPQEGLVMIKMREQARNSLFYLGEVLITEAKVRVNGMVGLGLVEGSDSDLARNLAIIDAVWDSALPEQSSWEQLLQQAEQRVIAGEQEENGRVHETRVNFMSMQEEEPV
jgi:alpha-D-ribose 1-methylphosphonate 5-triphosphate synthase subunit PhnG